MELKMWFVRERRSLLSAFSCCFLVKAVFLEFSPTSWSEGLGGRGVEGRGSRAPHQWRMMKPLEEKLCFGKLGLFQTKFA